MKILYTILFIGAMLVLCSACRANDCGCPKAQIPTKEALD